MLRISTTAGSTTAAPRAMPLGVEVLGLLVGNGFVAWAYLAGRMTLADLLWVYWLQSVTIGLFNVLRMASLRRFSTQGLKSNGKPVPETAAGKRSAAIFFLFHFGFFHLVYAIFLASERELGDDWLQWIPLTAASLVVGEAIAFLRHRRLDAGWKPNLGTMMFMPYLRIIPMHLTILFGALTGVAALIFLPLKIAADLGMLLVDHHWETKRRQAVAGEE